MFRDLVRKNKQIPAEECIALLTKETRGVLSVNGDDSSCLLHFSKDGKVLPSKAPFEFSYISFGGTDTVDRGA